MAFVQPACRNRACFATGLTLIIAPVKARVPEARGQQGLVCDRSQHGISIFGSSVKVTNRLSNCPSWNWNRNCGLEMVND